MIIGQEIRNPLRSEDILWLRAAGVLGDPAPQRVALRWPSDDEPVMFETDDKEAETLWP